MAHDIRAILLNIDGTLTNDNKVITQRTRDALLKCQEKGVKTACDGYAWILTVDCVIKFVAFLFAVSVWPPAMMLGVILAAAFVYWVRAKWGV